MIQEKQQDVAEKYLFNHTHTSFYTFLHKGDEIKNFSLENLFHSARFTVGDSVCKSTAYTKYKTNTGTESRAY